MRRLLHEWPALNKLLYCYQYVLMEQMIQSANCRCVHSIRQRLARWLLMFHDRVRGGTLQLTHRFLALMLGVRRSGVTVAAGELQDNRLINYRLGLIVILNRKELEVVSCECYRRMNQVYAQYIR